MNSLLIRFFLAFWLTIALTIGAASAVGYYYSERAHAAIERFEVSDAMYEASAALRSNGRQGLTEWLDSLPRVTGSVIYVVDERGRDLLGRRVPLSISAALRRFAGRRGPSQRDPGNLRPARPFTELVGTDGRIYHFFVVPPRGPIGSWFANRGLPSLAMLAFAASAAVSWLLAGTISRPVRRLRESATSIAEGKLDTRVAKGVTKRRDEIGLLARDFDRMASELQRSSHRQTELTRNVSHELRSPLARLRVALELTRRKTGELSELEKIDAETEKLDALIGQILEFSKLDADDHEQASQINVVDLVHQIVDDVRFEFGDKVELDYSCRADEDIEIIGFGGALRSAVENVIRNAARHGRPGGYVGIDLSAADGDVIIEVRDDGGGVDPAELEHLFEPFYRAAPNRPELARPGSGLGLAIAQRAVALHGGAISACNEDDGLRVTLQVPAKPDYL